ncbi:hypothetical protein E4U35_002499 [Claviceps purpurea]|nr:hypothetical protein E4U35_002499 [Claviceps purpurea]KAG6224538.1 hypothetical protein E4U34_000248 [Claviceps purpurea]KAG6236609.1 hypothetical protein E4U25_003529 [Claviceps purpurea]
MYEERRAKKESEKLNHQGPARGDQVATQQHCVPAMATHQQRNSNVQLLACLIDEDGTDDSEYRCLLDGRHVKYVSTAPGTFCVVQLYERTFEPLVLGKLLPPFPIGDWNKGHVARDPVTSKPTFIRTEEVLFAGVKSLWHDVKLDELEFSHQDRLRQNVHMVTHPKINGGGPVLMKLAVWPWEIGYIETETAAYQWICDKGVGPKFLGHLTEGPNGRVIGFITEWLDGTRPAGPRDLDDCKKTLARLHQLGIKHGDINRHNFLVREGHEVVLVDFETSRRDRPHVELEDEMDALKSSLESTDPRGGPAVRD